MFPYNLLILPLVGGYFIISNFVYFKYKYQRLDTPRLLLNAILAGILVCIGSFASRILINNYSHVFYLKLARIIHQLPLQRNEQNRYLGTLVCGLFIVILLTLIFNLLIRWIFGYTRIISNAVKNHGDELEQLFKDSVINAQAVQVTLKNEKVYLGIVEKIPEPKRTNYISLIPLYSGYREKDTKKMILTTSYEMINDLISDNAIGRKIKKMLVVIKQDEILTAQPHDPEIYLSFLNSKKNEKEGDASH